MTNQALIKALSERPPNTNVSICDGDGIFWDIETVKFYLVDNDIVLEVGKPI